MKARKLSTFLMCFLIVASFLAVFQVRPVYASAEYEYNDTGSDPVMANVDATKWISQNFTVGATGHTITSVKILAKRFGNAGTVVLGIRAVASSGFPTGPDLTNGTDPNGNSWSTSGEWHELNVTEYQLSANTVYAIVLHCAGTDTLGWYQSNANPYGGGNKASSTDSGSTWAGSSSYDMAFEVWGNALPSGVVTVSLNQPSDVATMVNGTISFNYTATSYGDSIQNATLWTNYGGTWQATQDNTTAVANNTLNTISYTLQTVGAYLWNVQVFNSTTGVFATSNYTISIVHGVLVFTGMGNSDAVRFGRKVWIAAGNDWVFFVNGTPPYTGGGYAYYASSSDGITFRNAVGLRGTNEMDGESLSVWYNGTYFTIITKSTSQLWYRMGTPQTNGTITWDFGDWQDIWDYSAIGGGMGDHSVAVDSAGYPYVAWYTQPFGGSLSMNVSRSSSNNGTWVTDTGYPLIIAGQWWSESAVIPLSNRRIYVVLAQGDQAVKGILYDGTTWGSLETISTSTIVNQYNPVRESWSFGAIPDQNDNIHLAFLKASSYDVIYMKRTNSTGAWSSETVVQSGTSITATPCIALNATSGLVVVFWKDSPSVDHIYYKRHLTVWDSNPTDLIDESTEHLANNTSQYNNESGVGYDGAINCNVLNGTVAIVYLTGWGTTHNLKFYLPTLNNPSGSLTVALNSPSTGSSQYSHTATFAYTPACAGDVIQNASLWTNATGSWAATQGNATSVTNNAQNSIQYTFSSNGTFLWNVRVFNSSMGVFASSNWTITILSSSLTVTLNSPSNGASQYTTSVTFTYTPICVGDVIQNASVWTNATGTWVLTQGNSTAITNNTSNSIIYSFSSVGTYVWNIGVFNSTTQIFASSNWTITILQSSLSVTLNSPSNGASQTTFPATLTYTPISVGDVIQNASLWVNASGTWQNVQNNQTAVANNTQDSFSYTFPAYGIYVWNVRVFNSTNGIFASANYTVTIYQATVTVSLNSPASGSSQTSLSVTFTYTPICVGDNIQNSSLWLNISGTWQNVLGNQTAVGNNTSNSFSYTFASLGTYVWNVKVYNTTSSVFASSNYTLTILKGITTVTLGTPADGSSSSSSTINFTYTPICLGDNIVNASLWLNVSGVWQVLSSSLTVQNNTANSFQYIFPEVNATYAWNIQIFNSTVGVFAVSNYTVILVFTTGGSTPPDGHDGWFQQTEGLIQIADFDIRISQGQTLSFALNVSWRTFSTVTLTKITFDSSWVNMTIPLPLVLTGQTGTIPFTVTVPEDAYNGTYIITVSASFTGSFSIDLESAKIHVNVGPVSQAGFDVGQWWSKYQTLVIASVIAFAVLLIAAYIVRKRHH